MPRPHTVTPDVIGAFVVYLNMFAVTCQWMTSDYSCS